MIKKVLLSLVLLVVVLAAVAAVGGVSGALLPLLEFAHSSPRRRARGQSRVVPFWMDQFGRGYGPSRSGSALPR